MSTDEIKAAIIRELDQFSDSALEDILILLRTITAGSGDPLSGTVENDNTP